MLWNGRMIYKEGELYLRNRSDTHLHHLHIRILLTEVTAKIWKGYVSLLTKGQDYRIDACCCSGEKKRKVKEKMR